MQGDWSTRLRFIAIFASVQKHEGKKRREKNETSAAHNSEMALSDFLQIWNVDCRSWRETLQQMWFQSNEVSLRYKGVKITFSIFLSIFPWCGAPASWARMAHYRVALT